MKYMIIDKERWHLFFKGFAITGVAYGLNNHYGFMLTAKTDHPQLHTRLVMANMEKPIEHRFSAFDFNDLSTSRMAFLKNTTEEKFTAIDVKGHFFTADSQMASQENPGLPLNAALPVKIETINLRQTGDQLYAIGFDHAIYRRTGVGCWEKEAGLAGDFRDIAAFGPQDRYAVGDTGAVWHYDGTQWTSCVFPSEESLHTVCCADDHQVYITGKNGSLWAGRNHQWEKLSAGIFNGPFRDTVWFAGTLWCCSERGIWHLKDGELEIPLIDPNIRLCTGNLCLSPDKTFMVSAGNHGAARFDGEEWEILFSDLDLE